MALQRIQPDAGAYAEAADRRGWLFLVVGLTCCHAMAVASTQVLNILVDPIKASLAISDTQFSLLQGVAFAVLSALVGVPLARIADSGNRRRLILAGSAAWSVATVVCGLVHTYDELFLTRVAVGIGEVCLFPAALSMIATEVPRERYGTSISIFGTGGPLGTALASYGGGWLLTHWDSLALRAGLSAPVAAWRITFICCGVLGSLLTIPLLLRGESGRRAQTHEQARGTVQFGRVLAHLGQNPRVFGGTALALLAMSFATFGTMAWIPSFFVRAHAVSFEETGQLVSGGVLVFAVSGARAAGILSDYLRRLGRRDSMMIVCVTSSLVAALLTTLMALAPAKLQAVAFAWGAFFFLVMPSTLGGAVLLQISPVPMQARVLAIQLFLVQLVGLGLGPTAVALLTDRLSQNEAAVGFSIAITCAGAAIVTASAFLWSCGVLRRKIAYEEGLAGDPMSEPTNRAE